MLGKYFSTQHFDFFFIFPSRSFFYSNVKFNFLWKKKKKKKEKKIINNLWSAEFAHSTVSIKRLCQPDKVIFTEVTNTDLILTEWISCFVLINMLTNEACKPCICVYSVSILLQSWYTEFFTRRIIDSQGCNVSTTKTLIRLRGCAGWLLSSLGEHVSRYVFRRCGSFHIAYAEMLRFQVINNIKIWRILFNDGYSSFAICTIYVQPMIMQFALIEPWL